VLDKLVKEMSEGQVFINDDYPVPPILLQIEAIPLYANRGIRGNGGSRRYRNKRTLRKKKSSMSKRSFKKHSFKKHTLKKRYF
jgi:hypothetical protein